MQTKSKTLSDYQVLLCGKATFTLECSGKRYTYRISKVSDEGRPPVYFASLLTGEDNESSYTYLGIVVPDRGIVRLTKASKMTDDSDPVRGIRWVVGRLFNRLPIPEQVRLLWSDRCQRCGRTLTVPSSIDARLGPECAGKVGF